MRRHAFWPKLASTGSSGRALKGPRYSAVEPWSAGNRREGRAMEQLATGKRNSRPELPANAGSRFPAWLGKRIRRSPGDELMTFEHLRCRGLLVQRFGEFARALLLGVEQPRVLDRDHRLVGEGGDQLDLPCAVRQDFARSSPITLITVPSRSSGTPSIERCFPTLAYSILVYSESARQSECEPRNRRAPFGRPANHDPVRLMFGEIFDVRRLGVVGARQDVFAVLKPEEAGILDLVQTSRGLKNGIDDGLHVGGRAEMTCKHLDVAVCCSSDWVSSRVRCCVGVEQPRDSRWRSPPGQANVVTSLICRFGSISISRCVPARSRRSARPRSNGTLSRTGSPRALTVLETVAAGRPARWGM